MVSKTGSTGNTFRCVWIDSVHGCRIKSLTERARGIWSVYKHEYLDLAPMTMNMHPAIITAPPRGVIGPKNLELSGKQSDYKGSETIIYHKDRYVPIAGQDESHD